MKTYNIWSEGWHANEGKSPASMLGTETAESFKKAVEQHVAKRPRDTAELFNLKCSPPTYWGCRLYDNEAQARKAFG